MPEDHDSNVDQYFLLQEIEENLPPPDVVQILHLPPRKLEVILEKHWEQLDKEYRDEH